VAYSKVSVMQFWERLKPDVAASLTDEQRDGLNAALTGSPETAESNVTCDLRLSFHWFFVVIMWGPERRTSGRLKIERARKPVLKWANAPVLGAMAVGYLLASFGIGAFAIRITESLFG